MPISPKNLPPPHLLLPLRRILLRPLLPSPRLPQPHLRLYIPDPIVPPCPALRPILRLRLARPPSALEDAPDGLGGDLEFFGERFGGVLEGLGFVEMADAVDGFGAEALARVPAAGFGEFGYEGGFLDAPWFEFGVGGGGG